MGIIAFFLGGGRSAFSISYLLVRGIKIIVVISIITTTITVVIHHLHHPSNKNFRANLKYHYNPIKNLKNIFIEHWANLIVIWTNSDGIFVILFNQMINKSTLHHRAMLFHQLWKAYLHMRTWLSIIWLYEIYKF